MTTWGNDSWWSLLLSDAHRSELRYDAPMSKPERTSLGGTVALCLAVYITTAFAVNMFLISIGATLSLALAQGGFFTFGYLLGIHSLALVGLGVSILILLGVRSVVVEYRAAMSAVSPPRKAPVEAVSEPQSASEEVVEEAPADNSRFVRAHSE
jgi:hypothetical protein